MKEQIYRLAKLRNHRRNLNSYCLRSENGQIIDLMERNPLYAGETANKWGILVDNIQGTIREEISNGVFTYYPVDARESDEFVRGFAKH